MDNTSWPEFLELLDSDRGKAFDGFYRFFAFPLLREKPPRVMRTVISLSMGYEFLDALNDFVLHCVENDFQVLRGYKDQGKPFTRWLYKTARNFFVDKLRIIKTQPVTVGVDPEKLETLKLRNPTQVERLSWSERLYIVRKIIDQMDTRCRQLLVLAGREFRPKEIARLLEGAEDKNKKVSDNLRYCRKKLKQMLKDQGYDIRLFLED
jgi:RNA polymerase sigma factor (sigma-70 family)